MVRMRRESCGRDPELRSQIDSLVILDRAVDLISPLPTQLTYEGLVDEMFGITCATVNIPEPEKKTLSLTSQEELFQELRGLNFNAVGPTLLSQGLGHQSHGGSEARGQDTQVNNTTLFNCNIKVFQQRVASLC